MISLNVQYNGGFLPDILLLTQAPIIIVVWFDGNIIEYYHYSTWYLYNYVLYFSVLVVFGAAWCGN